MLIVGEAVRGRNIKELYFVFNCATNLKLLLKKPIKKNPKSRNQEKHTTQYPFNKEIKWGKKKKYWDLS